MSRTYRNVDLIKKRVFRSFRHIGNKRNAAWNRDKRPLWATNRDMTRSTPDPWEDFRISAQYESWHVKKSWSEVHGDRSSWTL